MSFEDKMVNEDLVDMAINSCLRQQWARKCEEERAGPAVLLALKNSKRAGEVEIILCSPEGVSPDRIINVLEVALALLKAGNVR